MVPHHPALSTTASMVRSTADCPSTLLTDKLSSYDRTRPDSLDGVVRVVRVPHDVAFSGQELGVRVEPTDPSASVLVRVERWNGDVLTAEGRVIGRVVVVQVQ